MEPTAPAWVRQRDGSLEPFDADRICRALFVAAERLGRADAFLARELTDGVVHFLQTDHGDATPTADEVRDAVATFVRELGHPRLARAYAEVTTPQASRLPEPAGPGGFSRELLAAHRDGLLLLGDLDAPARLAARVLTWPRTADELEPALRRLLAVAETAVLDGPEHWLGLVGLDAEAFVARLSKCPGGGVLNLNVPTPPALDALAPGPLFRPAADRDRPADLARRLAGQANRFAPAWRVAWHVPVGETDAPTDPGLEYVFDRPRRGLHLAEGIDRDAPALLLRVGVGLARLPEGDAPVEKVGTLARLALSAGVQRRAHLRRLGGDLAEGFLLDRARLQVVPLGLDAFVEPVRRKVLARLRDVLRADGRRVQLATCLDAAPPGTPPFPEPEPTPGDAAHLRAVGQLHDAAERGSVSVALSDAEVAAQIQRIAATGTLDRVRLVRRPVADG